MHTAFLLLFSHHNHRRLRTAQKKNDCNKTYLALGFVVLVVVRLHHDQVLSIAGEQCNLPRCVSAKRVEQEQRRMIDSASRVASSTFLSIQDPPHTKSDNSNFVQRGTWDFVPVGHVMVAQVSGGPAQNIQYVVSPCGAVRTVFSSPELHEFSSCAKLSS